MAGYMFSNDVIKALEKHGSEMVNSVMQRAEAVYSNFGRSVNFSSHNFYDFLRIIYQCTTFLQINVERVVGCGEAKDVICGIVKKLKADMLIMGSHGYGFIKRHPSELTQFYFVS